MLIFVDVKEEGEAHAVLTYADTESQEGVILKLSNTHLLNMVAQLGWEGCHNFLQKQAEKCMERNHTGLQPSEEPRTEIYVISNGQAIGDSGLN